MSDAAPSPRLWPPGGLEHPLFDEGHAGEHYLVIFTFAGAQPEPTMQAIESALGAWSKSAGRLNPQDAVHAEEPFLSRTALRVRAHNLEHPRAALSRLLMRITAVAAVSEVFIVRLEPIGGDLFAPVRDPRMPRERAHFHDAHEFLTCLFDENADPPASEYATQLGGAIALAASDFALEERGMPLYFPGMRLGYGIANGGFSPTDARTTQVQQALLAAMERTFAGVAGGVPTIFEHTGKPGAIDRIILPMRKGYGFAIPSASLVYRYAQRLYRYREPEVFSAVVEAAKEVGLSACLSWQRFGAPLFRELRSVQTHVFQVWEP